MTEAQILAAQDAYETEQWDREMEQLRWAEAGGYAAGLARPGVRTAPRVVELDDGSNDIPF